MFTARGIQCLSSGPTELALELFNLVHATPRAAIGNSSRRVERRSLVGRHSEDKIGQSERSPGR